jgi:hypothetical protein
MPRKKIDPQQSESEAVPKRTRKASPKRESAVPLPELERPRIMSAAEKRQLILAHAANRRPVDTVQRFSLWTGVAICILAIGVGWVYTMRQTIIGALETDAAVTGQDQELNYGQLRESMHGSINTIVDKIDSLQEQEIMELREKTAMVKALETAADSIASGTADVAPTVEERGELFQPNGNVPNPNPNPNPNQFQIPGGVTIESSN